MMTDLAAVYWPTSIKPDGGRGFMDGSGWATIMLTWFYSLWWFTIADAAKTIIQWVRLPATTRLLLVTALQVEALNLLCLPMRVWSFAE